MSPARYLSISPTKTARPGVGFGTGPAVDIFSEPRPRVQEDGTNVPPSGELRVRCGDAHPANPALQGRIREAALRFDLMLRSCTSLTSAFRPLSMSSIRLLPRQCLFVGKFDDEPGIRQLAGHEDVHLPGMTSLRLHAVS